MIKQDTSVCLKALKDDPDLLDPDLRIFTCCQFNAMSELIVFVNPSEVRNAVAFLKVLQLRTIYLS
jgi:hypothetical protein